MDIVVIVLLVLGVIAIILSLKGKPLWSFVKDLVPFVDDYLEKSSTNVIGGIMAMWLAITVVTLTIRDARGITLISDDGLYNLFRSLLFLSIIIFMVWTCDIFSRWTVERGLVDTYGNEEYLSKMNNDMARTGRERQMIRKDQDYRKKH